MRIEHKLLVGALAQSVSNKPLTCPEEVDWSLLAKLSGKHMVAPLVYNGLQKAGLLEQVPEKPCKFLKRQYHKAIYQDSQSDYLLQQLTEKLVQAQIPHIFLKGARLKHNYPEPALRTMCDMDVLVYAKDFAAIDAVAKELGGTAMPGDGNHRNYSYPNGVLIEFHPNLLHHDTPIGTGINPGWQYARKDLPTCAGALTEEGFYLNTICHLANHFVAGGVGVRFVLDVWVCRHLRNPQPDRAFVEAELQRFGLLDFARNIEALAEAWFGSGELTDTLEELGEYILTSGLHGTSQRAMLNAVTLSPGGSRSSALMKKAFYSRAEMEDRFPWVKGKPWLLPAAWCARAFRAVKNHGDLILKWSKETRQITQEEVARQQEKLERFGIYPENK